MRVLMSFLTSETGSGLSTENRIVPELVENSVRSALRAVTVLPLNGKYDKWSFAAMKPAMTFPSRRNAGML